MLKVWVFCTHQYFECPQYDVMRIFSAHVQFMLKTVHCTLYAVYKDVLYTCKLFYFKRYPLKCLMTDEFSVHMLDEGLT